MSISDRLNGCIHERSHRAIRIQVDNIIPWSRSKSPSQSDSTHWVLTPKKPEYLLSTVIGSIATYWKGSVGIRSHSNFDVMWEMVGWAREKKTGPMCSWEKVNENRPCQTWLNKMNYMHCWSCGIQTQVGPSRQSLWLVWNTWTKCGDSRNFPPTRCRLSTESPPMKHHKGW